MLTVKIKNKSIRFKNSFKELTIEDFAKNIKKEQEIEAILKQVLQLEKDRSEFVKICEEAIDEEAIDEASDQIDFLEAAILERTFAARMLLISQLSALTSDPMSTENFLLSQNGINAETLNDINKKLQEGFADFHSYFAGIKEVKRFQFEDYKKAGIFGRRKKTFEVKNLDSQTVIRDAGATIVAQKIGTIVDQFSSNNWRNFARFVAYVARPKKEEFEYLPNRSRLSFIGGNRFEQMSAADRLTVYNNKLQEVVEERTKIFSRLPVSIAIGIYKYYFILKKNFPKPSPRFIQKIIRQQNKQSNITKNSEPKQASKI